MVKVIKIKEKLNKTLEMNSTASNFIDELDELPDKLVHIDFSEVKFISRSFAQGYYSQKMKLDKEIVEVNIPEQLQPLFDIMEKNFKTK